MHKADIERCKVEVLSRAHTAAEAHGGDTRRAHMVDPPTHGEGGAEGTFGTRQIARCAGMV